jgi:hypothetical protein
VCANVGTRRSCAAPTNDAISARTSLRALRFSRATMHRDDVASRAFSNVADGAPEPRRDGTHDAVGRARCGSEGGVIAARRASTGAYGLFGVRRQRASSRSYLRRNLLPGGATGRSMMSRVLAALCALVCAVAVLSPLPARADAEANALSSGLLAPANASLQRAMATLKENALDQIGQANPVGSHQAPLRRPSLPQGLTYNVDWSFAYPYGPINFNKAELPGGMDAGFGYAFSRTNRLQVGYYEAQQFPVGFSNKNVPFYVQGFTAPGTSLVPIMANTGQVDAATKDKIFTAIDQNLFVIGGKVPIVFSPTYLTHTATVNASGPGSDLALIEYNGLPYLVHQRTEQEYFLPVTLPFLATPRMFGTLTAAPQWLVHTAGINETNHAQLFALLYLEYRASKTTTIFFQPSRLIQYNPDDPYPEYTPTFIYGLAHHFSPATFVQMSVLTGGATNYTEMGITGIYCQNLPSCSTVATSRGGLKATTIQIQLGFGSPTVLPL